VVEVQFDRAGLGVVARHAQVVVIEGAGGKEPCPARGVHAQLVDRVGATESQQPRSAPRGVVLTMALAELIRGLVPRRYSLISARCAPIGRGSHEPGASARCWLMSASMATTGSPRAARCRTNSADSVVLPLPPLPANAIFADPPLRSGPCRACLSAGRRS
jgi:hypothetical protein